MRLVLLRQSILKGRTVLLISLMMAFFLFGRYSATDAAQRISLSRDQFLIGIGMVKVTLSTLNASQEQIIRIAEDQMRGRYTRTQASDMIQKVKDQQSSSVETAVMPFLSRNTEVSKEFITGPPDLSNELLETIEYLQTKFPRLFSRYMD